MARSVYLSFDHGADADRARQIRDGRKLRVPSPQVNPADAVLRLGPTGVQREIDRAIWGSSCVIVLVGRFTRGRQWVNYEILRAWNARKGVLGIHVDRLLDDCGQPSARGPNPFDEFDLSSRPGRLSSIVPLHEPPFTDPRLALAHICDNIETWMEDAIRVRREYRGI